MSEDFFQRFPLNNLQWRQLLATPTLFQVRQRLLHSLAGQAILPDADQVFAALDAVPVSAVRVLIVGQDPYPTPGDAHGLAFSVAHGRPPRSLQNIFKEIERDCGGPRRQHGCLNDWAQQGVLLLNRVLTTPPSQAGGHQGLGWEAVTEAIIDALATRPGPLAVLLWGAPARKLTVRFHARDDLLLLQSGHPSPLAYNRPHLESFKGCGHFAAVNAFLRNHGLEPLNWRDSPGS